MKGVACNLLMKYSKSKRAITPSNFSELCMLANFCLLPYEDLYIVTAALLDNL
jgi:multidrug transporter EmrE-like cation transporter